MMQNFIAGLCIAITVVLSFMDNRLERIEKAVVKPVATHTACKLT